MNRPEPRAILLDALGTLVELLPPAPRLRQELVDRFGLHISKAQARDVMAAEIGFYRANLDAGRDAAGIAALRAACAEVVRSALPESPALEKIGTPELTTALLASLQFRCYEDALPALRLARQRGTRLVVLSNWDASLQEVLARLRVTPLLDGVLTSAEVGARKPAPEMFERALALCGVAPRQAWHVGDTVDEDVAGARGAGIEPVLLRREGGSGPPGVRTIHSLHELQRQGP